MSKVVSASHNGFGDGGRLWWDTEEGGPASDNMYRLPVIADD